MHNAIIENGTQADTGFHIKSPFVTYMVLEPCTAGHQPNGDDNGCEVCPLNTYKTADQATADWKSQCTNCTAGQETVGEGSTESNMCFGKSSVSI